MRRKTGSIILRRPFRDGKLLTILLSALFFLVFSLSSYAQNTQTSDTQKPAAISSGSGSGGTVVPELFTGAMSYSVPIEVPPGRHSMDPELILTYNSGNGNGWVGVGWELHVGSIERNTRFGLNYDGDAYILRLAGGAIDLVRTTGVAPGDGEFRAKIESGFLRIKKTGNSWEVTDKTGTQYFFGETPGARQDDPGNATRIFKWSLERVIDTNGNYMSYVYSKNKGGEGYLGQVYLDRIKYAGHGSIPTGNEIVFYTESRSDAPDLYTLNFRVRTTQRLKTIDILANGHRMRTYSLMYKPGGSASTSRSLLESVQQFGKDAIVNGTTGAVTGGTSLPSMTFGWQAGGVGFVAAEVDTSGSIDEGYNIGRQWADLNGDGRADFCRYLVGSLNLRCTLSAGEGFGEEITSSFAIDPGVDLQKCLQLTGPCASESWVDVNGDGRSDFCRIVGTTNAYNLRCTLSTGSGFATQEINTSAPIDVGGGGTWVDVNADGRADFCRILGTSSFNLRCTLAKKYPATGFETQEINTSAPIDKGSDGTWVDLNADGKADFCRFTDPSGGLWHVRCTLSTGSGFETQEMVTSARVYVGSSLRRGWADVNDDGKLDFCRVAGAPGSYSLTCLVSTGTSFAATEIVSSPGIDPGFNTNDYNQSWVDANGDGKADFCRPIDSGKTSSSTTFLRCTFSTGTGFSTQEVTTSGLVDLGYPGTYQSWVDLDGDGKLDFCRLRPLQGPPRFLRCTRVAPPVADLLISVSNGLGGTTTVTYVPSTQYSNTQLPLPMQTLSSTATNDGNGIVSTTNYVYSGGYFHLGEREFRGFHQVTVTGPTDPDGKRAITHTWFHQGNDTAIDLNNPDVDVGYMKGKPYRMKVVDEDGQEFSKVETTYTADGNAPYFNPPSQIDSWTCEGSSCDLGKKSRMRFASFDAYGNPTLEYHEGDFSDPSDDKTIVRTFTSKESSWIVGLPLTEIIYKGLSTSQTNQVAATYSFYDQAADCNTASSNTDPDKGNLTRVVRWLRILPWIQTGTDVDTRTAYNNFGNPICMRDASGHTSTISYDSSGTFPTIVTNPLNQLVKTEYYGVDNVLSLSDKGLYGQVKKVTDPNNHVTTHQYDPLARKTRVDHPDGLWTAFFYNSFGGGINSQHIRTDTSAGLSSWDYFDGLGRTILVKKTGPGGSTIVTKQEYNVTGTVRRSSLPYFEGSTPKWKNFIYDSMGRMVNTANPDQSTASVVYGLWTVTVTDASGHQKRETRDAYGRLKKVEEFTGVAPTVTLYATTNYTYDVLGNLLSVTDDQGNKMTMRYDTLGRKIAMSDPDMGSCGDLTTLVPNITFPWYPTPCWSYLYDANGNLIKQIDAQGTQLELTYDSLNRLLTKSFTDLGLPSAPSGLTATAISASRIDLSWSASSDNLGVKEYRVERCNNRPGTPSCSNFVQIISVTTTSYSNTGLTDGMDYTYRVRAMDTSGNLGSYSTAMATTPDITPPSVPTLTATAFASNRIDLSWTASTDNVGVTAYHVQRCQGTGCTPTLIATVTGTSYNDTQRAASTTYTYRVRATDAAGNLSGFSSSVNRATPAAPADSTLPTFPTSLTATAVSPTQVNLTWTASTDNLLLSYYEVERSSNNGPYTVLSAPVATNFTDNTVTAGITYLYRVRAVDGANNKSNYSTKDLATTILFSDDPLVTLPGSTVIKAIHITQLRQAVNAVRAAAGLAASTWTDATLTGILVRAVHIQEVRTNLNQALTTLGLPAPSYTDPTLTPLVTAVKAVHIGDPRQGVK